MQAEKCDATPQPVPRYGRVCYVLGAGFSAATRYGCPTSRGFLSRELTYLGLHDEKGKDLVAPYDDRQRHLTGLLERVEAHFGPLDKLDLEAVMTDLHTRTYGVGRAWEDERPLVSNSYSIVELQRDYEALLDYICLRLNVAVNAPFNCELVVRFVNSLKSQDSILTLNYDTIVERHLDVLDARLERLGTLLGRPSVGHQGCPKPIFVDPKRDKQGVFVKLHGSTDWLTCGNKACPNHGYIGRVSANPDEEPIRPREARCDSCGWSLRTLIIPPTSAKAFDEFPRLGLMWSRAYHALRRASRWVFMGVSFAANDFHLTALLRSASGAASYFKPHSSDYGEICVVSHGVESANSAKNRLVTSLCPGLQALIHEERVSVSLFGSVAEYLEAIQHSDGDRGDASDRPRRVNG